MIATTRAALIRGTISRDALGDEVESSDPVPGFEDVPASIIERETREFDQASNAWRTVRYYAIRLPGNVPVDEGDRIRDLNDGAIYALERTTRKPRTLSGRSSVTLRAKRTTP